MTVVFLARRFYPLIGGVEKHVFELTKRLIAKGHKVIVITENPGKLPRFEPIQPPGFEIYRISVGDEGAAKKYKIWREMWKLRDVIRKADVVHCHDVFFWYLPFRYLFPKKKVFTTFHGYESYPISKKAIRMRKLAEKLSWGNLCIGDFIPKWYGTKATYVSYGAVDIPKKSKKFSLKGIKNYSAVFIGRLDDQTGILTYVDAVKDLKREFSKFSVTVVGDGPYKRRIQKYANVVGFQNNPEKYFSTNHFAFVSRYLAILEAFAAERLVFAVYDNPVKKDYLTLAPFAKHIVIAGSPEELREKIIYYLQHPEEEKKLIEKSFTWVKGQSWENLVAVYLKLWNNKKTNFS